MSELQPFELALIAASTFAIFEVISGTLIFLGFGLGCLTVAAVEAWSRTFSLWRDATVFAAVSALAIVGLRMAFRHRGDTTRASGDINDF
jgi:membrane protein implicated in regulation of membrane protease activity